MRRGCLRDAVSYVAEGATWVFIAAVRCYQVALSPIFGDCCRFHPSCSEYMIEALKVHGPVKGTLLGCWRILRCHPFGAKGYDPVPEKGKWRVYEQE